MHLSPRSAGKILLFCLLLSAAASAVEPRVLVYQRNGKGYVHDNLAASAAAIRELGLSNRFQVEVSTNASVFTDDSLKAYGAIIFANSNNEAFETEEQRSAFQRFVQRGGGFMGIHSSTGSERQWTYFQQLQGAKFLRHPPMQAFTIHTLDRKHPATKHLPEAWSWTDECYLFTNINPNVHVLLAADLKTVKDAAATKTPGQAINGIFPLAWSKEAEGSRQFYTALGHKIQHYSDPIFREHLLGGILWILGEQRAKSE